MQSENTTNISWKNKLDDASLLPDEIIQHKNISWQKLNARLHQKPRRKRVVTYWLVAACVLFALLIPFIYLPKPQYNTAINTTKNTPVKRDLPTPNPITKETTTAAVAPAFTTQKKLKTPAVLKKTNADSSNAFKDLSAPANEMNVANTEIIPPAFLDDSSLQVTMALPQKKKLKVVHINELGDPIDEPTNLAGSATPQLLPWKLGNGEVFSKTAAAYKNTAFPLLKIKPSTSN